MVTANTARGYVQNNENAYGNMGLMLNGLGINTLNIQDYNSKFGLNLQKRLVIEIDSSKKLIAESVANSDASQQKDLIQTIQTQFDIEEGHDMILIAMADVPPVPVYQATASTQTTSAAVKKLTYGVCYIEPSITVQDKGGEIFLAPYNIALHKILPKEYTSELVGKAGAADDRNNIVTDWLYSLDVKRLNEPEHGVIIKDAKGFREILYAPNKNYIGKDRLDFLVTGKDLDGKPFEMTVKYYINMMPDDKLQKLIKNEKAYQQAVKQHCGSSVGKLRISETDSVPPLSFDFAGYSLLGSPTITLRNLTGAAIGETTGSGTNATITLDTDAAGHGWYEGGMFNFGGLGLDANFSSAQDDTGSRIEYGAGSEAEYGMRT